MSGYTLHAEAFNDTDEIRAYVAEDDPDAADRVITAIFDRIRALVAFPARKDAVARFGGVPRTPQPARDGRYLEGQGVTASV